MRPFLVIFLAPLLMSCNPDAGKSAPRSNESAWQALISTGGCLVGSQDAIDRLGEGTCLAEKPWVEFLGARTDEKIDFLCQRMASTDSTEIHHCSFGNATEGELAVYALQHLTDKLWIDYSGPSQEILAVTAGYRKTLEDGGFVSGQAILWEMLGSDAQRSSLIAFFKESPKVGQAVAPDR